MYIMCFFAFLFLIILIKKNMFYIFLNHLCCKDFYDSIICKKFIFPKKKRLKDKMNEGTPFKKTDWMEKNEGRALKKTA
jgi:hypothetical protein